jgi:uncharacterized protein YndB with AHSA1/START domain
MTTKTATATTQMYAVYIKATPQAIWDAITQPDWTEQYLYGSRSEYELRAGGAFRATAGEVMAAQSKEMGYELPDVLVDGEVLEADPPRKLVQTWRMLMDPGTAAEPMTRLTWEIKETEGGVSKLTVVHDLVDAPLTAGMVSGVNEDEGAGGGWSMVLSGLKTLLETGTPMYG